MFISASLTVSVYGKIIFESKPSAGSHKAGNFGWESEVVPPAEERETERRRHDVAPELFLTNFHHVCAEKGFCRQRSVQMLTREEDRRRRRQPKVHKMMFNVAPLQLTQITEEFLSLKGRYTPNLSHFSSFLQF